MQCPFLPLICSSLPSLRQLGPAALTSMWASHVSSVSYLQHQSHSRLAGSHGNPRRCARAHPRPGHSRYRGRARRRPSAPVAAGAEYAVARPSAPPGEARRPGLRSAAVGLLIRKHRPNPNPSSPPCSASPRGRSPSSWSRLHPWPPTAPPIGGARPRGGGGGRDRCVSSRATGRPQRRP